MSSLFVCVVATSEHRNGGQLGVDSLDETVDPGGESGELGRLRPDHLDELRHLAVRDLAELGEGLHAAEDVLLGGLAAEELEDGHGQLAADVVENLEEEENETKNAGERVKYNWPLDYLLHDIMSKFATRMYFHI